MEKWRNGEMEKWRNGEMEKWRNGEMEKWRNIIIHKVDTYLEENQVPYVYFFCKDKKIRYKKHQNDFFENFERFLEWEERMTERCFALAHLQPSEATLFTGPLNLVALCQNIYVNKKRIGVLVLGGFRVETVDYHSSVLTQEELKQFSTLPKVTHKKEMIALFSSLIKEINHSFFDERFVKIVGILEEDINKLHTLQTLSEKSFFSESTIQRLIKIHTGNSFKEFYIDFKLSHAVKLKASGVSDEKIAQDLGYVHSKSFLERLSEL